MTDADPGPGPVASLASNSASTNGLFRSLPASGEGRRGSGGCQGTATTPSPLRPECRELSGPAGGSSIEWATSRRASPQLVAATVIEPHALVCRHEPAAADQASPLQFLLFGETQDAGLLGQVDLCPTLRSEGSRNVAQLAIASFPQDKVELPIGFLSVHPSPWLQALAAVLGAQRADQPEAIGLRLARDPSRYVRTSLSGALRNEAHHTNVAAILADDPRRSVRSQISW